MADAEHRSLLGRVSSRVTGRVAETVDLDVLLEHVDVNQLLDRVDVDRLLDRVDPNRLLDRVDPNRLLDRVDPDRLLDRVDPNRLLDRVDLEAAVRRSGVPDIVAESTGHLAGSALDVARRQVVGLDFLVQRVVDRLLRRDPATRPTMPPALQAAEEPS